MSLETVSASRFSLEELAALFTRSFEDYLVPIQMTSAILAEMMRVDGICHDQSRVLLREGRPAGLALVARRGRRARVAGMGLAKEARGVGRGRTLVEGLIEDARRREDEFLELEVIEQNVGAVRLYEKCGFRRLRRLVGFERSGGVGEGADEGLEEVDCSEVGAHLLRHAPEDLPWQLGGDAIARLTHPHRGYRLGPAWAAISDPAPEEIRLRGLVVEASAWREGWARRLILALLGRYPERRWRASVLVPEEIGPGLFEPLGFHRLDLTQWQMRCPLGAL